MTSLSRGRLLAGAALGFGLAFAPQQAEAACTVTPAATPVTGTVVCGDTTTTDSTFTGTNPSLHREYDVDTSGSDVTATVSTDAVVDGNGLAFTNTVGAANDLIVVNSGTVQVDVGEAPTFGGTAALNITAIDDTSVDYSGDGDVTNLGTGGGLVVDVLGDGSFTGTTAGDISAVTGQAVIVTVDGTGSLDFTSTGSISSTDNIGISGFVTAATGGDLTLTVNDVSSDATATAVNALSSSDTGNVTVTAEGDLTGGGGISAQLGSATATGDLSVTSNGTITADVLGISAVNAGAGDVTVTAGDITATASDGVFAQSSGGAITVETGAVTAGAEGIVANQTDAAGTGAISVTTNGAVTAATTAIDIDNAGTGAVTVAVEDSIDADAGDAINVLSTNAAAGDVDITTGDGDITGSLGGIIATNAGTGGLTVTTGDGLVTGEAGAGISATLSNAAADGNLEVNVGAGGATGTGADAVVATTAGTGDVTVSSSGAVESDTGAGINVGATTGAIDINVTGGTVIGATDGIVADSTGPITVDITGGADVTGVDDAIQLDSSGEMVVNIGAGSVLAGPFGVNAFGGGTIEINNAGTLGEVGGTAVLAGFDTAAVVDVDAGGVMNGIVVLSDLDDTVNVAGTWNADGIQDFGLGVDDLNVEAGGVLNTDATTVINGLETLDNAGTLNAELGLVFDGGDTVLTNTGDINAAGTIDFGGGVDDFANDAGGVFTLTGDTVLAGLETMSNDGEIDLGTFTLTGPAIAFVNTGTVSTDGDAALLGFTTFDNDGLLDLGPGTLTVIVGQPFTNSGTIEANEGASEITGQTVFNNTGLIDMVDDAANDTLTIDSDFVGSGDSTLAVDFTGDDADLLIINGDASGETVVDANFLGGFDLDGAQVVDAVTADDDAFVLGAVTGDTPLVDFALVQDGADFFLVAAPTAATFDPLAVVGFGTSLWYQSADEVIAETSKPATTQGISFWGDVYWSRDEMGDDDNDVVIDGVEFEVDNELETKRHGIQLGVDYGFAGGGRVGLTGGWGRAQADGDFTDLELDAKGWNIGLYGQFGGITGFHGEFLAKHDRYDAEFDDGAFDGEEFDIKATGVDVGLGYRFGFGGDATMDAKVGIAHVRTKVDDINAFGFDYDIEKLTSTRGRAGLRAVFGGGLSPYIDGTVFHEFKGDGDVELFDGAFVHDLDTNGKGTWVRLEAGLSGNDGPGPILAAWGDLGDKQGFGIRAGWRLGGRVAEALPPPPPPPPVVAPPPPPPPATQTCPDGSVILATDACPPPPPPPPPPPEPERG